MLEVESLSRPGLSSVSLRLDDGECLAVRGPSGAGKTLLLRAIADLDPNEGMVRLAGTGRADMPAPDWRRRVAYLPAEPGWWAERAGDHFPDGADTGPLMEALGLAARLLDRPVRELSTGERQRLALVRLLLNDPRVFLLDEPTGALDAKAAAAVERVIAERLGRGGAALWVTHNAAQARRVARRVLWLEGGRAREAAA